MHLSGGDYKLLEPLSHIEVKKNLKITSKVFIKVSNYEIEMDVENMAKKADPRSLTYTNNFMARQVMVILIWPQWNLQLVGQMKNMRLVCS